MIESNQVESRQIKLISTQTFFFFFSFFLFHVHGFLRVP